MSKQKRATKAAPSKDSQRSVRRANRGFKSLEESSRKHRRALRRLDEARTQYNKLLKPGEKSDGGVLGNFVHTGGGAMRYH